ncbi:methylamine utilization protein [Flammeovirga yaeyamensis]|uniref:Methylamine utilization protein n=1 Tax=Flammeovirga yaeyamensis TaxID=367791 RepID=A0AAX1N6K7_9BACT|nr:cytochrome c peroxidase [Flammeovirga yaeyamensis]MBB3697711.1 cytochrome c peroxidase [Flammeovirga yaeyamensis]NMF35930.1 methylamine utilization protein [Flammeovirga yaeyamensis]QWG03120.1 methylamine utilization protein [Flammeovirga yaeyamensis]
MKKLLLLLIGCILMLSCESKKQDLKSNIEDYYYSNLKDCRSSIEKMSTLSQKDSLIMSFDEGRKSLKKIESIMCFYSFRTYKMLNSPNLPEVEEFDNADKVLDATGFQVIEEMLFTDEIDVVGIHQQCNQMLMTIDLELGNHKITVLKPYHLLWSIRDELIRITSLGISGFDSPVYLNSLEENVYALQGIQDLLDQNDYLFQDQKILERWDEELENAKQTLKQGPNFDRFDRYHFIKDHIHHLMGLWVTTSKDWKVEFPFDQKVNYEALSLFHPQTFNTNSFMSRNSVEFNDEVVELGQQLFHDASLSGNNKMSCASCHDPKMAFTDGRKLSITNKGKDNKRNAPTLMYAGLQASQFYDARQSNLETQIQAVVDNKDEFDHHMEGVVEAVQKNEAYVKELQKYYKEVDSYAVRNSLAMFVHSLSPFQSKFDKAISNIGEDLAEEEVEGFNLFMGKAKCGTCHFAPIFNGTVPPHFTHSELEVLGVPKTVAWEHAEIDQDKGRYDISKAKEKMFAFKTPTVRNINVTAPYMHNGVFNTLDEVIQFYNMGGGHGIGITLENQTLPTDSLHLTISEVENLKLFLGALSDPI